VIAWLQLLVGTVVVLLPGFALGRGLAEALLWSVAVVAAALAVTFAVHGSLLLTLVLVLLPVPFALRRLPRPSAVGLAGLAFGIAMWPLAGAVRGDALFHLGRIRKLTDFGDLSLGAVNEFADGGLHPGYAFPLWHGWLALVGKVTGLDPTTVVRHEASLLVPVALVLAFELGRTLFRSTPLGIATMLAQVALIALAPGGAGAYLKLENPGTASRQLLVPATLIVFIRFVREPTWQRALPVALGSGAISFVHGTYALFLALVLGGFALARLALVREWRVNAVALVAYAVPMALVYLWLRPVVDETVARTAVTQGLKQYETDLVVHSPTSYALAPEVVARSGAVAVAALVLVPVALFASSRRWAALVLGGTAVILAIELWPPLFTHFSDLVSLSQSRRAAGFVPFAIAFAGGLAVLSRRWLPLLALGAGIWLQLQWPGDFGLRLEHGGPGVVARFALVGAVAALVVGALRPRDRTRGAWLAAALFVLPVAIHGFANWDREPRDDRNALTPGVLSFLEREVPERAVVFADLETSYRIAAYLPVYVANGPPTHVAATRRNDPYRRREDLRRFLRGDDAVLREYDATWLVLRRGEWKRGTGTLVYRDERFRVYRL
jgi:hypothetical protein